MKLKSNILLLASFISLTSCRGVSGESFDFNKYEDYRDKVGSSYGTAKGLLPPVDELGEYNDVQFSYKKVDSFIFVSEGIALFLDYNEVNYALAKSYVEGKYTFIDQPCTTYSDSKHFDFPVASFMYKDYSFRIAPTLQTNESTGETYYICKSFVMTGYNESMSSVAYLYYHDFDIDFLYSTDSADDINQVMPKLIEDSFFWRK